LLHPFCPHITEEFWENIGNKPFISLAKWPVADVKKIDEKFEKQEEFVKKISSDIIHIKSITGEKNPCAYIYAVPQELSIIKENQKAISTASGAIIIPYATNDPLVKSGEKDPEGKSKKSKPGKPGIYIKPAGTSVEV